MRIIDKNIARSVSWRIPALVIVLVSVLILEFWPFDPNNYDECLEEYQGNAESTTAVQIIFSACANKFKTKKNIGNADCLLKHAVNTRSDVAVKLMVTACSEIYIEKRNKPWSNCILKKMDGIKTDLAAQLIAAKC